MTHHDERLRYDTMPAGAERMCAAIFLKTKTAPSGCWEWIGHIDRKTGYGRTTHRPLGTTSAHRLSWHGFNGAIPSGVCVDHVCRNRKCANPDHLRLLTNRENVLIGVGPTAVNAAKTNCPLGHPYSGMNLIVRKNGRRDCRACKAISDHERRSAK